MKKNVKNKNTLTVKNPALAAEWHPTKNGALTPKNISYGSGKKVWWKCNKGHEWKATVNDRSGGTGCPYCSGKLVSSENNLKIVNPNLAKEWHPIKNGNLKPKNVTYGSGKKVWWKCNKGHEWKAIISNRIKGTSCPYCAGLYPTKKYNLKTVNPQLSQEWHSLKNTGLKPTNVLPNSNKKVWWICSKGHEWQAAISKRNSGQGCPYCIGKKVSKDNNLEFLNPKLAKEWHPTKNKNLTPKDVTLGSTKKVWWKCNKGHEWETTINDRSRGTNCPFCSGNKVSSDNNLKIINPKLAKEWHPSKNRELNPEDFFPNSNKKVWWTCKKGHEWRARIGSRNKGARCPFCSGIYPTINNNLEEANPSLAKEWHPKKNKGLMPKQVLPRSNKKVWWICKKGHEWQATINSRYEGIGCPYCSGRRADEKSNLQIINPKLAKEWHPNKNKDLIPRNFTPNSGKKVWWICKKGHEWEAAIYSRNSGSGCPYCSSSTSIFELRVYSELKYLFKEVKHRVKLFDQECDVFLPNIQLAIEIDGVYWHKNKYDKDLKKTNILNSKGITVLHIRERGLKKVSKFDIFKDIKQPDVEIIKIVLLNILKQFKLQDKERGKVQSYIKEVKLKNDQEFKNLLDLLPCPLPGMSLTDNNKKIAVEWHPTKNGNLTPKDVTPGSNMKVWWMCKKNHEWKASIYSRNDGAGCPYCSRRKASEEYNLEKINPKLSGEWHPLKNGSSLPGDFTPNSGNKVWWLCKKGHQWEARIDSRNNGTGCPYCSGNKVSNENNLKKNNPKLAKEWHPKKNGELTPVDVSPGSHKKVWWLCNKGHQWIAEIKSRNYGIGCPYCSRIKASKEYNLEKINPELSKEWHPLMNNKLTPRDVTPSSNKKIWWRCPKGHEWQAKIVNRKNGRGCPFCSGRRVSDENCLESINPKLAKEWHPKKNGELIPKNVTPGSNKKVWWICKKGHEWQATINNRNRGSDCPYCHKEKKL